MCKEETIRGLDSGKLVAVPKWSAIFRIVIPIGAVVIIFGAGMAYGNLDSRIFKNSAEKEHTLNVVNDKTVHMSYERKIEAFVPRTEIEYKFEVINNKLDELIKNNK